MPEDEDPEKEIARLRQEISDIRKKRMAVQRTVATTPVVETALERTSRDRSSGATGETDALREQIQKLRDDIVDEARSIDKIRSLFQRADAVYPGLPQRGRMVAELNNEATWRNAMRSDERRVELRLVLPSAQELV